MQKPCTGHDLFHILIKQQVVNQYLMKIKRLMIVTLLTISIPFWFIHKIVILSYEQVGVVRKLSVNMVALVLHCCRLF